jgi:hypothetical protein
MMRYLLSIKRDYLSKINVVTTSILTIAFPNCIKYKINQKKIKRHNPEGVEYRIAPGETWGSKISKKMYLTQSGNAISI